MQSYKFTSTFYFIVYVCEHWCCGQLLRSSRTVAAVALSPWAWEAAACVLPLVITEPHWPPCALGRPGPQHQQNQALQSHCYHLTLTWLKKYTQISKRSLLQSNAITSGLTKFIKKMHINAIILISRIQGHID